jgi:hypothetical protein
VLKWPGESLQSRISGIADGSTGGELVTAVSCIAVLSLILPQKLYYTSNLFFVLALGLSKLSVVFFLMRLTPARHHRRVFWAMAIFVGAWTFASLLAVAVQCDFAQPWILVGERCPGSVRLASLSTQSRIKIRLTRLGWYSCYAGASFQPSTS